MQVTIPLGGRSVRSTILPPWTSETQCMSDTGRRPPRATNIRTGIIESFAPGVEQQLFSSAPAAEVIAKPVTYASSPRDPLPPGAVSALRWFPIATSSRCWSRPARRSRASRRSSTRPNPPHIRLSAPLRLALLATETLAGLAAPVAEPPVVCLGYNDRYHDAHPR